MQEALRAIRLALLEADVNFKVVKQLIDHIQEKAIGQQVATALSPAEQVIKILRDELIEILGRDTAKVKFCLAAADRRAHGRPAGFRQNHDLRQAGELVQAGRTSSAAGFG
jgi:signal recognition particle GTPase